MYIFESIGIVIFAEKQHQQILYVLLQFQKDMKNDALEEVKMR